MSLRGIEDLPQPIRDALMPVVNDIEKRVRKEAASGAQEALMMPLIALGVGSVLALVLSFRANRVLANRGLSGVRRARRSR